MFGRQLRAHRHRQVSEQKPPQIDDTVPLDDTKSLYKANKQLQEEMQLDFEEISDGELDEENKIKSLGDALGVDWSSIVEESKKKVKDDSQSIKSAKERWQAHRILLEIGVSTRMAGEDFAGQVIKDCYAKLKQELITAAAQVKRETGFDGKQIKSEDNTDELQADIESKVGELLPFTEKDLIDHPYAFAQIGFKKKLEARRNLIVNSIGPYSRALCARQDLKIRRKLCGLPEEELTREPIIIPLIPEVIESSETLPKPQSSIELAFQMFRKATERVC